MKFVILLDILIELLSKRKLTASYVAEKHGVSERSVYRYVDVLSLTVPVYVKRGRNGGIYISDTYKLPMGFMTKDEYEAAIEALSTMYAQLPDERFLAAKHKLSSQFKTEIRETALSGNIGTIIVDSGTWGDTRKFSDKLHLIEDCIKEKAVLEIDYRSRLGESTHRKIESHALIFKQNVWYVYAFCRKQRAFRLFHLGRIFSSFVTGEKFNKRPFKREDIPLSFWSTEENSIDVRLEIEDTAFADVQDWLGVENLTMINDKWTASVTLPDDDVLIKKLIALGSGVKIVEPESLKEKLKMLALDIANLYN